MVELCSLGVLRKFYTLNSCHWSLVTSDICEGEPTPWVVTLIIQPLPGHPERILSKTPDLGHYTTKGFSGIAHQGIYVLDPAGV